MKMIKPHTLNVYTIKIKYEKTTNTNTQWRIKSNALPHPKLRETKFYPLFKKCQRQRIEFHTEKINIKKKNFPQRNRPSNRFLL